jgi:sulfur-oxidizing protein SoxY
MKEDVQMSKKLTMTPLGRRDFLRLTACGATAALLPVLHPAGAMADAASTEAEIKKLIGDKKRTDGRITLELPQIAENGNTVPIAVEVESPMTDSDYVKAVHLFAEQNPNPSVATFRFSPQSGKAWAATRIRLIKTQNIVAVAEMSDGSIYSAKAEVKVTIGGCGG